MMLARKDLLGLRDVSAQEITLILDTAAQMKHLLSSSNKKSNHLTGKSIVTLFYENSTRTRMSFELASKYMSAVAANISASGSSVAKGETLIDTGRTLDAMGTDLIIIRHPMSGAPHILAKHTRAGIINAGDGMNEHPTQALLDMMTMREHFGGLEGLKVAIVGDILHSRVARSNMWGLTTMGAKVVWAGPRTLMPPASDKLPVECTDCVEDAVRQADVVMALRIQQERMEGGLIPSLREYHSVYGINAERLAMAKPGALLMHPGPMNRGVEVASNIADGDQSVINAQVTSGVAVRMAVMFLLTRRGER